MESHQTTPEVTKTQSSMELTKLKTFSPCTISSIGQRASVVQASLQVSENGRMSRPSFLCTTLASTKRFFDI